MHGGFGYNAFQILFERRYFSSCFFKDYAVDVRATKADFNDNKYHMFRKDFFLFILLGNIQTVILHDFSFKFVLIIIKSILTHIIDKFILKLRFTNRTDFRFLEYELEVYINNFLGVVN